MSARATAAAALFVLGCASAALALLALSLNPADAGFLVRSRRADRLALRARSEFRPPRVALAAASITSLAANKTQGACAPTGQAAANLRASSVLLLLAVAALALAATVAALVPARPFAPFACAMGAVTAHGAVVVLPWVVACQGPGRGHVAIAVYYGLFVAMLCAALLAAIVVAVAGDG